MLGFSKRCFAALVVAFVLLFLSPVYGQGGSPTCSGTTNYTARVGNVEDGSGSAIYSPFLSCEFLIQPIPVPNVIILTFNSFATESGYDYLSVIQNDNVSLGIFSGISRSRFSITAVSSTVSMLFTSDESLQLQGFNITYQALNIAFPPNYDLTSTGQASGSASGLEPTIFLQYTNPNVRSYTFTVTATVSTPLVIYVSGVPTANLTTAVVSDITSDLQTDGTVVYSVTVAPATFPQNAFLFVQSTTQAPVAFTVVVQTTMSSYAMALIVMGVLLAVIVLGIIAVIMWSRSRTGSVLYRCCALICGRGMRPQQAQSRRGRVSPVGADGPGISLQMMGGIERRDGGPVAIGVPVAASETAGSPSAWTSGQAFGQPATSSGGFAASRPTPIPPAVLSPGSYGPDLERGSLGSTDVPGQVSSSHSDAFAASAAGGSSVMYAPPPGDKMSVSVRTMTGQSGVIEACGDWTAYQLMQAVESTLSIPVNQQTLVVRGQAVAPTALLYRTGLQDGDSVFVLVAASG